MFTLSDINSSIKYFIQYDENPSAGVKYTDFSKSKNLSSNEAIENYLQGKINTSNRIHKPDKEELLIRRFIRENQNSLDEIKKASSINKPIEFKPVTTNEEIFNLELPGNLENADYIIVSRFKGPVLGFNKSTQEYFCVWKPPSMYDWIVDMEFNTDGFLILLDDDDDKPEYLIDLHNSIYVKLKHDDKINIL